MTSPKFFENWGENGEVEVEGEREDGEDEGINEGEYGGESLRELGSVKGEKYGCGGLGVGEVVRDKVIIHQPHNCIIKHPHPPKTQQTCPANSPLPMPNNP